MVKCPFCREHVGGEQNFRHHLWLDCEEAPREVNTDVSDWKKELEDEMAEFMPEEDDEESEEDTRELSNHLDYGEVLPV
jgi:hypothetical protein